MDNITVLVFIIIIAAVMVSEDKILTVLAASVALNLALLFSTDVNSGGRSASAGDEHNVQKTAPADVKATIETLGSDALGDLYGPQYDAWSAHNRSYDMYPNVRPHVGVSCAENDYSVDTLGTLITQKRGSRDKRAMDGAVSKGVDYYKYHYGSELDEEEAKPWWGRHEW